MNPIDRRGFLTAAGIGAAALVTAGRATASTEKPKPAQTTIPRWRGFNLLDYFSPRPMRPDSRNRTTEDDFRWMSDWGFDFIRLPMAYPQWINFDRSRPITPDDMVKISFDLVNEPSMREDMNNQHSKRGPVPGDVYRRVAEAAAKAIRQANPNHLIIADGNNTGNGID